MLITSKDNSKIKQLKKLYDKKTSFKEGLFVIEGENLIEEAIKNNLLVSLFVREDVKCEYKFDYINVTCEVMKSISSLSSTPRLIGISKFPNKNKLGKRVVLLDEVQDPGNVGTIIRSCVAFNIDTIVLSKNSANPFSDKVLRSTGGMIYNINIIIDDLESVILKLKESNIKVYGTSLSSSNSLESITKSYEYAIIFGNEGNGISKKLLDMCDENIRINMNSKCESLNVGVSSGIVLYHMFKG